MRICTYYLLFFIKKKSIIDVCRISYSQMRYIKAQGTILVISRVAHGFLRFCNFVLKITILSTSITWKKPNNFYKVSAVFMILSKIMTWTASKLILWFDLTILMRTFKNIYFVHIFCYLPIFFPTNDSL